MSACPKMLISRAKCLAQAPEDNVEELQTAICASRNPVNHQQCKHSPKPAAPFEQLEPCTEFKPEMTAQTCGYAFQHMVQGKTACHSNVCLVPSANQEFVGLWHERCTQSTWKPLQSMSSFNQRMLTYQNAPLLTYQNAS
jgi:hypothetical protein